MSGCRICEFPLKSFFIRIASQETIDGIFSDNKKKENTCSKYISVNCRRATIGHEDGKQVYKRIFIKESDFLTKTKKF